MPSSINANCIVIVDSIPDGELNTARQLREELRDWADTFEEPPGLVFSRVVTASDLQVVLVEFERLVRDENMLPVVHVEAHGWDNGLQLASGDLVSWTELKEWITPLNVAMRLGLLFVLAACKGATFTKAIRLSDPAPLWGISGPTQDVTAGRIEADFRAFYRALFDGCSTKDMLAALVHDAPENTYYATSAEEFFFRAWKGYKETYCTDAQLAERAKRAAEILTDMGKQAVSEQQYRQLMAEREPKLFERYRDTYFMVDLYPENKTRFPVTYEQAEQYG